jgi:putative resolvase
VVEHRDRLGRVNTELVEAVLSAHHRRLVVLGVTGDPVGDMAEVLTGSAPGFTDAGRRGTGR